MKQNIAIEELENARKKILQENLKSDILEQLDSLEKAIAILRGEHFEAAESHKKTVSSSPLATSLQGLVINAVVELIRSVGRQVSNDEIINYLEEKKISLGAMKNKRAALASILFKENKKSDGKIKQVERGQYYLRG